uniref:HDC15172 n=1 Tax=Drosophila melanogaster TaxID=7227 RepID=Q6IJD1_DROME|nr:TPA_inf: HDC15172 [Drosophila melanogaster]
MPTLPTCSALFCSEADASVQRPRIISIFYVNSPQPPWRAPIFRLQFQYVNAVTRLRHATCKADEMINVGPQVIFNQDSYHSGSSICVLMCVCVCFYSSSDVQSKETVGQKTESDSLNGSFMAISHCAATTHPKCGMRSPSTTTTITTTTTATSKRYDNNS